MTTIRLIGPQEFVSCSSDGAVCTWRVDEATYGPQSGACTTLGGKVVFGVKTKANRGRSPDEQGLQGHDDASGVPRWYVARENDTPRKIAVALGIDAKAVVAVNKERYPTLSSSSRLREGTQICIPRDLSHDLEAVLEDHPAI